MSIIFTINCRDQIHMPTNRKKIMTYMQKLQLQMPRHFGQFQSSRRATSSTFSPYLTRQKFFCLISKCYKSWGNKFYLVNNASRSDYILWILPIEKAFAAQLYDTLLIFLYVLALSCKMHSLLTALEKIHIPG